LATTILALVAAQLVVLVIAVAATFCHYAEFGEGFVVAVSPWITRMEPVRVVMWFGCFVTFLVWLHRATKNLPALGTCEPRFKPGTAVGLFLLPVVNLVMPYVVLTALWQDSQPSGDESHRWRRAAPVTAWYVAMAVMVLAGRRDAQTVALVSGLVAAIAFANMVLQLQRRQDEQWLDLERRRNLPQPTAEALR
jgi:hypothetical protein